MDKKIYVKPMVEKIDEITFPGMKKGEDIAADYTCSGTGWNSGVSRGCLIGPENGSKSDKK